ncbi:hypothetical protein GCM10022403_098520 [Streptomyces coacervatus]|uniref:Uncharacterized protein n=1 Tax=Streptomyces coacervatus TaxID=647381 RepID=A0ABP7JQF4_9ACTN|nr:hypothetical protein [Streptomyces coacervatus]MDF2263908.1 hypothetical protein [Streptomyces coacervatus]
MPHAVHGGARAVERPEVAEAARTARVAHRAVRAAQGRVVELTADEADAVGRTRVERARLGIRCPVLDRPVVDGHLVLDRRMVDRHVVVRQCVGRAAEEEGRLGQPRVECGRPVRGAGFDPKRAELGDLPGRQAKSSCHLAGVAVELLPECRVDSKAGHGIAKGVVGHVLKSPSVWAC